MDAKVILLAEAPGADEEDAGVPLIGRSGSFLFDGEPASPWPGLDAIGLGRKHVRCENVLEVRPLNNDLTMVSKVGMEKARASLAERLAALSHAEIIVPMGNCALNALLGSPLKQRKKRAGGYDWVWPQTISAWRGSVNQVEVGGRTLIMIPTFHPVFFLYGEGANFQAWRADWEKVMRAATEGIAVAPMLHTIVAPTWDQVRLFERLVQHTWHRERTDALLAFDIETIGPMIDCIGFCVDGETTLTLPLLPQLWPGGASDVRRAWETVQRLLAHDIPKGTWWGYYDVWRLKRQKGFRVTRWWWDGYALHHLLDPADEHSLGYCASRDLDVPYWKHENKVERKGVSAELKRDWHRRHAYNGKDTGYTWHLIRKYQEQYAKGWPGLWRQIA